MGWRARPLASDSQLAHAGRGDHAEHYWQSTFGRFALRAQPQGRHRCYSTNSREFPLAGTAWLDYPHELWYPRHAPPRVQRSGARDAERLFVAGGFRVIHTRAAGELVTMAIRSRWIFSDSLAAEELRRIFVVERSFCNDHRRASFLVVIPPYEQDLGSSDGTVFTNAFQLYLSRKQTFGMDEKSLLAHQVFHTWNPQRIGVPPGNR